MVNIHGNTPLHEAARSGNQNTVKVLIHFGADVNHANQLGETALHIASECGKFLCIFFLLVLLKKFFSSVPDHEDIVRILVNKGAKIDVKNNTGSIPVVVALRKGKTLLINSKQKKQFSAILYLNVYFTFFFFMQYIF